MEKDKDFRKQIKDALEHLYDTAYLETHPLLAMFSNQAADSRLTRAQKLRTFLKEAIEAVRPPEGFPSSSPEWRSHMALRQRYLQGASLADIESELGISQRQLQRELHKGLDAVAALFMESHTAVVPGATEELSVVESELDQWEISRQDCELQTLLDDALWMIKPILNERGLALHLDSTGDAGIVYVDATLTRQAIFKALRSMAHQAVESLSLIVVQQQKETLVVMQSAQRLSLEMEEDWRVAQLICQQQGMRLEQETNGGTQVTFSLPQASQRCVLVIDDNAAIHQLFERYLALHHYEIIHARSGPQAIELATERQPDVITLDVMMPNMDGWQVLRTLTSNPATKNIPVAICSVLKEPELAFSLGASAYLKKPVDRTELVSTLAQLLASTEHAQEEIRLSPRGSQGSPMSSG